MAQFVLPGASDRSIIIGGTGTGKTVAGAWLLSKQRFDKRPWIALDFKDEVLWDKVGDPPMRELRLGTVPKKLGLYRVIVNPGQEDELEQYLWDIWERGNVGLFCDDYSEAVRLIAKKWGLPVIDFAQDSGWNSVNYSSYLADVVHPNVIGYRRMGEIAIGKLKSLNPISLI